jgi:hypothetical protein
MDAVLIGGHSYWIIVKFECQLLIYYLRVDLCIEMEIRCTNKLRICITT